MTNYGVFQYNNHRQEFYVDGLDGDEEMLFEIEDSWGSRLGLYLPREQVEELYAAIGKELNQ